MLAYDYFVLYFITYAFVGWVWEFVFIYATEHRFHWHGFLRAPILPIYGFSALGMILFVRPFVDNPALVFLGSLLVVTALELGTGFVLDKVFHMRLWDYRSWPLNLNGYVSLFSSLGFGAMGLLLLYVVQPWVGGQIQRLPEQWVYILGAVLTAAFVVDFANSLSTVIKVRIEHGRGRDTLEGLQKRADEAARTLAETRQGVRRVMARWYQANLTHLRASFPRAELTGRNQDG